jgi:hypothetical protein
MAYGKFNPDEILSPRYLILKHIDRISEYMFHGETEKSMSELTGTPTKPVDKRQVICDAVDFAVCLLKPYYDDKMNAADSNFIDKLKKIEEKLAKDCISYEAYIKCTTGGNIRDFDKWVTFFKYQGIIPIAKTSGYYEVYMTEKFKVYLVLFEELNQLLLRKGYLKDSSFGEGSHDSGMIADEEEDDTENLISDSEDN